MSAAAHGGGGKSRHRSNSRTNVAQSQLTAVVHLPWLPYLLPLAANVFFVNAPQTSIDSCDSQHCYRPLPDSAILLLYAFALLIVDVAVAPI